MGVGGFGKDIHNSEKNAALFLIYHKISFLAHLNVRIQIYYKLYNFQHNLNRDNIIEYQLPRSFV